MEYVSLGKAAKALCVRVETIRSWVDKGKIKAYRTPTRRRMVLVADIERIKRDSVS